MLYIITRNIHKEIFMNKNRLLTAMCLGVLSLSLIISGIIVSTMPDVAASSGATTNDQSFFRENLHWFLICFGALTASIGIAMIIPGRRKS